MSRPKTILFANMFLLGLLAGCETMNSSYDCPLSQSASCMALHDMDSAVSQGLYPKENNQVIADDSNNDNVYMQSSNSLPTGSYPKRTKDRVAKIWLAPYEDSKGDYHEQSNVYAVVKNSTWANTPIKATSVKQ